MSHQDNRPASDDPTGDNTSAFRADFAEELDTAASPGAPAGIQQPEGLPPGSALLIVTRGPNAGARFLLDRPVTAAGRYQGSDIFLDDVTVSRRHAEFHREAGAFRVIDVGSLNGTYVNRESVDSAVLANGDHIQLGKFRLVFLTSTDDEVTSKPQANPDIDQLDQR
ncbi:FHA domain-containing protein [uncultured Mycobacterium sp.]|uniref:FHA domain-containing protein n=1 Tax=uncultured Mycobacterium sp. TaxID=171292 RepID=UPI0035CBE482